MSDPCQKEDVFEIILYEIREARSDIKKLTAWKWSVYGGSAVIAALISWIYK